MAGMAPAAKRTSAPKAGRTPGPPPTPPASSPTPCLRFHYPEALRQKTLAIVALIEQAPEVAAHRDALADAVMELTNSGMDYFFMQPLERAQAGFVVEQSASLGMSAAQQVMASVIHQILGRMENPQLLSVCNSIRQLMV